MTDILNDILGDPTPSGPKQLNRSDIPSILKDVAAIAAGAVLPYLLELLPLVNFGPATPAISAVCGMVLRSAMRYYSDNTKR